MDEYGILTEYEEQKCKTKLCDSNSLLKGLHALFVDKNALSTTFGLVCYIYLKNYINKITIHK